MDKRIIEETPSSEVLNDDWFIKDSPTGGTSKILGSNLKEIISGDVEDSIDKILDSIAPEWSSTFTYGYDAYVIYEGELWRCFKDTGSTRGEFKTSEWIKAVTSGYISHVIEKIANRFVASTPPYMTYVYSVGDMVFYSEPYHDEQLYVCNTDLPQGESTFNPEHWDVVYTVAGLSKYLMDKIAEAGQIDDVQVKTTGDYESVVDENKVAKIDLSNMLIEKSVPNLPQSVATFNDGSDLPLKSLTVSIEPVQEGSGDPSPTNIRTISGWTEEVITRTGVNVWDEEWEVGLIDHTTGNNTTGNGICSKNYISIKANTNYYAHISTWYRIAFYDDNNIYISGEQSSSNIFTTPTNAKYMKFSTNALYGTTYNNDISINYPSTDTEYHAYNGHTYTIDLGDTRYGGTLDVVNGVLTVDRVYVEYDGSNDEDWSEYKYNTIKSFRINISDMKALSTSEDLCMCDRYKYQSFAWANSGYALYGCSGYTVYFRPPNDSITSLSAFKTWLSSNNIEFIYPLATPLTIQLTPTSIKSLDGENNVFASTGDVTKLEYIANATDVIANLEARVTALES